MRAASRCELRKRSVDAHRRQYAYYRDKLLTLEERLRENPKAVVI